MTASDNKLRQALEVAIQAAWAASVVIKKYYRAGTQVNYKADDSPVTRADVEAEKIIRKHLTDAFPDHGFYGEETGGDTQADQLWLVDPIDGTKSFVRGYPYFSTQIALQQNGELVVGVSYAPINGELATAVVGQGCQVNGVPGKTSDVSELSRATLSLGNLASLTSQPQRWQALGDWIGRCQRTRGYGDYLHYHMLAAGQLEMIVEADVNILDIAALTVILREAGAKITDLEGNDVNLATTSVLAATPAFHADLLEQLTQ